MILPILLLLACKGEDKETGETGAAPEGPTLGHTPPTDALTAGETLTLDVTATDDDGVAQVVLYYRTEGQTAWDALELTQGDGDRWTGALAALEDPGLDYYFKATDGSNLNLTTYLPEDRGDAPYNLQVSVDALPLPYEEGFEPGDGEEDLLDLGWWAPSLEFQGSPWGLGSGGYNSDYAALHLRSSVEDNAIDDWLISPPLDLSSLPAAMVSWVELGSNVETAQHSLYISTTERDPGLGTYTAVTDPLHPPSDQDWGASLAYDLSAWAGEPVVYLAWVYRGAVADDWAIDDISVRALAPNLDASLSWSPDPADPGDDVTLSVTLVNTLDVAGTGLTATLDVPTDVGTLDETTVTVGDIAALGTASADWTLHLDPAAQDNQVVPLGLTVTDGVETWDFELEFVVGERSTANLTLVMDEATSVEVVLGVGDPDAPSYQTTLYSGSLAAGETLISADISDQTAWLPPARGPLRWFAAITAGATGKVDAFGLSYDGASYTATILPKIEADTSVLVYVPEPPAPEITDVETDPDPVSPGDAGVELVIELTNTGADSIGPVTATLTSDDPDGTLSGETSVVLDSGTWKTGEDLTFDGVTLDVASGHTSSRPLAFTLTIDDGYDTWDLPLAVEVPWPSLNLVTTEIDDDGRDGVLDPGESADLTLTIGNTGDSATFGSLDATLSASADSDTPVSIDDDDDSCTTLGSGASKELDFEITVPDGAAGDVVRMLLTLDDGTETYEIPVELTLGEAPWQRLTVTDDAVGDQVDDYAWDYEQGLWRVQDGMLEFWLTSDVVYDPDTLFIEAWATSTGADYTYYRLIYQSGSAVVQGYTDGSGFTTLASADYTLLSETELLLSVDTSSMGLLLQEMKIGFAAGWCGPDTYYCDHYPDGWGYPYISFSTGDWFALSW